MKWKQLLDLLEQKKRTLQAFADLNDMFREIESIQIEIKEVEVRVIYKYSLLSVFTICVAYIYGICNSITF